mgnify:FL=1
MTSVRLDEALEEALARTAEAAGETPSEFIRAAIRARIEAMSSQSAREALAPFIGVVESEHGSDARRSGEAFTELLSRRAR